VQLPPKPKLTKRSKFLFLVPLAFSAFTHLWNPIGFPFFEQDEGINMLRSIHILEGLGPQLSKSVYFYTFDHPYFGQLFLGSVLKLIGYPDLLQPKVGDIHSIEMLYLVPRVLMGVLAVIDTFLVYKIAETRYNRKVAFIAATLFAVMPLSWMLRRGWLDSIQLPFLLLSILFALYYSKRSEEYSNDSSYNERNKKIIPLLLSGVFLGLAIFTKVPAFTMIPLIVFILIQKKDINKRISYNYSYDSNTNQRNKNKNLKTKISSLKPLGIWFVPVILIPMIWPAYAMSVGQLDEWLDGIFWQATRADRPFPPELQNAFTRLDPVLIGLAAAGLIYAIVRSDYFILLWAFPLLVFLYLVNWVYFFHLIPIFPAFCIAITTLLIDLFRNINKKRLQISLEVAVFAIIIMFGFMNTTLLITQSLNSSYFGLVSYIIELMPGENNSNNYSTDKLTLIGPGGIYSFYWIASHVFNKNSDIEWFEENRDYIQGPIKNEKFIMVVDRDMRQLLSTVGTKQHVNYVSRLYNNSTMLDTFEIDILLPDLEKYPFTNMLDNVHRDEAGVDIAKVRGLDWGSRIDIRGNY
jgi:Ca2+/Na+ antiporter